jgi:hypothetical protein
MVRLLRVVALVVSAVVVSSCSKTERSFYVSPYGSDENPGTRAQPFLSLEKARNSIRSLKAQGPLRGPVTVFLRDGTYALNEPFVLFPADSGRGSAPIIYSAYESEKPVISGGQSVRNWSVGKLNGHSVLIADLSQLPGGFHAFEQLWVNGRRAVQARTPNRGYLQVAALTDENGDALKYERSHAFAYDPADEAAVIDAAGSVAVVFNVWLEYHMPVERVDSERKQLICSKQSGRPLEEKDSYYLEGGRSMLDQPGEWFLDRDARRLYYYPLAEEKEVVATIPSLTSVVRLEGDARNGKFVEHVHFKGLSFRHASWVLERDAAESGYSQADIRMDGAVRLEGARNCLFDSCEITAIGNYGFELSLGCTSNRLLRCAIHDLGAGGVLIGPKIRPKGKVGPEEMAGTFPPVLENPADATYANEVADCRIHDGGRYYHCAVGIWVGQSPDNHIHHNEIYNFYYTGISTGWTWGYGASLATGNIYEYNHIHDIGKLTNGDGPVLSDLGGIYSLGNHTGSVIRYNKIHDIWAGKYGGWALYCDEGTQNLRIENNLVYRSRHACFNQHYGKGNRLRNNIFAFADVAVVMMARIQPHPGFTLENNILLSDDTAIFGGGYEYQVEQKEGYTSDRNLIWCLNGPVVGAQNRNPSWLYEADKPSLSLAQWQEQVGNDRNSMAADPGFVNPAAGDFTLPEDTPALKIGFVPFSLDGVGPR